MEYLNFATGQCLTNFVLKYNNDNFIQTLDRFIIQLTQTLCGGGDKLSHAMQNLVTSVRVFYNNNTALMKQISMFDTALVMTNNQNF